MPRNTSNPIGMAAHLDAEAIAAADHRTMVSELKPCPMCQKPLTIKGGFNPSATCETDGCWLAARKISMPTDDERQVEMWNTRPTPATDAGGLVEDLNILADLAERDKVSGPPSPIRLAVTAITTLTAQAQADAAEIERLREGLKLATDLDAAVFLAAEFDPEMTVGELFTTSSAIDAFRAFLHENQHTSYAALGQQP